MCSMRLLDVHKDNTGRMSKHTVGFKKKRWRQMVLMCDDSEEISSLHLAMSSICHLSLGFRNYLSDIC